MNPHLVKTPRYSQWIIRRQLHWSGIKPRLSVERWIPTRHEWHSLKPWQHVLLAVLLAVGFILGGWYIFTFVMVSA